MKIVIDTREQKPWSFGPGVEVVRSGLGAGDYSIAGLEDRVALERKSASDLASTIVGDWLRFVKQLRRMAAMDVAVIAVEATPDDIHQKKYMGEANPASVMGKCHAIYIDYGVPVLFWGNREAAQREAYHFLQLAAAKLQGRP